MARPPKKVLKPLDDKSLFFRLILNLTPQKKDILISHYELNEYSELERNALSQKGLLTSASRQQTVNCDQCEYQCRNLETIYHHGKWRIVCSLRDDTAYIDVSLDRLESKRFSIDALVLFLKEQFDCLPYIQLQEDAIQNKGIILGIAIWEKFRLVLSLCYEDASWKLCAGKNVIRLTDALGFDGDKYQILSEMREYLLMTDKSTESRKVRAARWLAEIKYSKLHPEYIEGPIYEYIARRENLSVHTVGNELKQMRKEMAGSPLVGMYFQEIRKSQSKKTQITL